MFRAIISPILRSNRMCLQLVLQCTGDAACWWLRWVPPHPGHQQAASPVRYSTSCKDSLVLLRMGEIIVRNMLSWLKLLIKLLLLHLVGCLYYCISDARSHKHQTCVWNLQMLNFKFMVNENSLQPLLLSIIYANHFYQ